MIRLSCIFALLVTALGCPNPEKTQAPEDLVGLAKWFWVNQRTVTDEEIEPSLINLHPLIVELTERETNEGELVIIPAVGPLASLTTEEIVWTGLEEQNDPENAPGLFLANQFECDFDTLTEVLTAPNQNELHPGVYDTYDRDYSSNRGAFLDGEGEQLLWETSYSATPTVTQYSAVTSSGVRRALPVESDLGPAIIQGTFLPNPADFGEAGEDHFFDQDYQLEIFYEADNRIHHFYAMWRSMQVGAFGVNDEIFINFTLDALVQWDGQNEDLCETWPALP